MERVSIRFGDGALVVADEKGRPVECNRVTVFLVVGNEYPVALLDVAGAKHEVAVSSLDVKDAAPIVGSSEIVEEMSEALLTDAKKKGGRA